MDKEKLSEFGFLEILEQCSIRNIIDSLDGKFVVEERDLFPNKNTGEYKVTLSQVFGLNAFPYHTDGVDKLLPPKWIILEYTSDRESRSGTELFDVHHLSANEDCEDILYNEVYLVGNTQTPFLTPIINKQLSPTPIVRWNRLLMKKLNNRTSRTIEDLIDKPHHVVSWIPGKKLIFNNWRILHARQEVSLDEIGTRQFKRYNLTLR